MDSVVIEKYLMGFNYSATCSIQDSLTADRDRYKALLDENERNADATLKQVISVFDFARNALAHFDNGDISTKRAILTTIGSNWKLFRGLVHTEAKFPFLRIREGVDAHQHLHGRLEPTDFADIKSESGDFPLSENEISIWWPRTESNCRRQPLQGCALPLSYRAM